MDSPGGSVPPTRNDVQEEFPRAGTDRCQATPTRPFVNTSFLLLMISGFAGSTVKVKVLVAVLPAPS